jgi:G3E family GTPase
MIPLILLVGFLGSGKTTFLRGLLVAFREKGVGTAVILNDFQNASIDAETVRDLTGLVQPIHGSCVCCGSKDEFLEALSEVRVSEGGVVVVEANGTTDAIELLETLGSDPRSRRFVPIQVSLIDAKKWRKRLWNNSLEEDQVRPAAWIAFSRLDLVSEGRIREVREAVRKINERALEVGADQLAGLVKLRLGKGFKASREVGKGGRSGRHGDHHLFSACQVSLPKPVESAKILAWLSALPESVIRVKGVGQMREAGERWRVFQWTGGDEGVEFLDIQREPAAGSIAVVIGCGLDPEAIRAQAKAMGL